jgi:actin-related protein
VTPQSTLQFPPADLHGSSNGPLRATPPLATDALQRALDELVFERFGFGALYRTTPPQLAAHALRVGLLAPPQQQQQGGAVRQQHPPLPFARTGCGVVVDLGFSATTITPFVNWAPVTGAIRR